MNLKILGQAVKETLKEFLIIAYVIGILAVLSLLVLIALSGAYWLTITVGTYIGIASLTIDKVIAYVISGTFMSFIFYAIFIDPFVHNYKRIKRRNERYEG